MSGTIVDNLTRTSGTIAPTSGGLSWSSDVITASTATVSAGNGYWINTTSNACTVTLPSSADIGDKIVLADYARTWATNNLIIDSNGLNFQGSPDTYTVDYSTAGQSISIIYSDSTKGWIPISDDAVTDAPVAPVTQKAIFGYGEGSGGVTGVTNLVNSSGVVAADVAAVGTVRIWLAAASYGGDKAIFGYGNTASTNPAYVSSLTNLVSNSGVVATDTTGVGTARHQLSATSYGDDKAIFGFGEVSGGAETAITNLVNSSGVVATDTTGVGTVRKSLGATSYGGYGSQKAIFGYGLASGVLSLTNLVSTSGVVASDVTGVGSARSSLAAASYGGDKAIFGYGNISSASSLTNLVSSSGVVATDTTGVGTARPYLSATSYGGDKAIFGYGETASYLSMTNLVSNSGVVASDVSGVGTARSASAAAGFSLSA